MTAKKHRALIKSRRLWLNPLQATSRYRLGDAKFSALMGRTNALH